MQNWKTPIIFGTIFLAGASAAFAISGETVAEALADRLPRTEVTSVECDQIDGLCEVVAGNNLFYVDESARYLIVGRVYDMETRQDLTAARLLEMNPDLLLGGSARRAANSNAGGELDRPSVANRVDLSALSADGAIRWGNGSDIVTVFSDFRCHYCRTLHSRLAAMDVTVIERPISVLGSRDLSESVICAANKASALRAAYADGEVTGRAGCNTDGLDENEAFARQHGFTGTPVLVRADGAVIQGLRSTVELERWIAGGAS